MLDDIKTIRDHFREEGRVIKGAPVAFIVSVILIGAVAFGIVEWHYAGLVEDLQTHNALLQEELKGLDPQQTALISKRKKLIEGLQIYYVSSGSLLYRDLPKDISSDDFAKYQAEVNQWVTDTATWINKTMGSAATAKFLDIGSGFSFTWDRAANKDHNNDINLLVQYRKNLSILIETSAWDKPEAEDGH